jgi:hypothetical protein
LAQGGVQVVFHNTLAAADYGLIDGDTLVPRPDYWAALLWHRTMGKTVLEAPHSPTAKLRLYAHCLPNGGGGVGLVALNLAPAEQSLAIGGKGRVWMMTGQPLDTGTVLVNGRSPTTDRQGNPRHLYGERVRGTVSIAGQAIAFLAFPGADNPACK